MNVLKSGLLVLFLALSCGHAVAAPPAARELAFDIPAQQLRDALNSFGRQAGLSIAFYDDAVADLKSEGLAGSFTPQEALARLLANTPLQYRFVNDRTVAIQSARANGGRSSAGGEAVASEPIRLSEVASREEPQSPPSAAAGNETEEVIVTGSRLSRSRTDGPTAVTVLDREDIDRLGATTISDVLKYIPQNTFTSQPVGNPPGTRTVQLRGLSAGTTLVLINGRRTIPGANTASQSIFDLNTVPLSAIERIEILADSASAVYGADAVGGVVNLVLKSSVERSTLDIHYGSADGGAQERGVALSAGGRSSRAQGLLVADYFDRGALEGRHRDIINNADYRRFGGVDRRVTTTTPGNVCAVSGNLPGLTTPCAAVPVGSTGVGLTLASFAATAGQQNLRSPYVTQSVVPLSERYSLMASGAFDLTDTWSVFGEFMYADRKDSFVGSAPVITRGQVSAGNPFNPFGVPVLVDFELASLGRSVTTAEEIAYREVAGVKGRVKSWDWELSVAAVQNEASYGTDGFVDTARVNAALAATAAASALNVFQDGPGGSFALLNSLVAIANVQDRSSNVTQVGGFARGGLFNLPAGRVRTVVGGEWRDEDMKLVIPGSTFVILPEQAQRHSTAAYAELSAPLVSEAMGVSLAHEAELTVAGRYDEYSGFGSTFNMQFGATWRPVSSWLMRASYGDAYRAPGLYELFQPRTNHPTIGFVDPRRNNEPGTAPYVLGGNPQLEPETSTAWTVGTVWTPSHALRPRLSASLWNIEQDNRIVTAIQAQQVLANEAYVPERVVRAAPTAADIAAGLAGRVVSLDRSLANLGRLRTQGLDLELSAQWDSGAGLLSPKIAATRIFEYRAADFPVAPLTERVGLANINGTISKWKIVGSLGWERNGLSVSGTARYTPSYDDMTGAGVPTGLRVGAQALVDMQLSANLEQMFDATELMRGTSLRLGAINVFDKLPDYASYTVYGYDYTLGDIRGRFLYAALSKQF